MDKHPKPENAKGEYCSADPMSGWPFLETKVIYDFHKYE